jgi:hypothetical protein
MPCSKRGRKKEIAERRVTSSGSTEVESETENQAMTEDLHASYPTTLEKAVGCTLIDEGGGAIADGVMFQPEDHPIIFCIDGPEVDAAKLARGVALRRGGMTVRGTVTKVGKAERPLGAHVHFEAGNAGTPGEAMVAAD